MPSSKTAFHNGFTIVFDEEKHTYTSNAIIKRDGMNVVDTNDLFERENGLVVKYRSVTSWVGSFFPKFDAAAQSAKVAANKGVSQESVLAGWEAKKNSACRLGTRVHEVCEDVLLNRPIRNRPENEHEIKLMKNAWDKATEIRKFAKKVDVEKILFDPSFALAGTADGIVTMPDGSVSIIDWKTNDKAISMNDRGFGFGLPPITSFPDTDYWHYTLQLNTYQYLLEKGGYFPPRTKFHRFLFHITESGTELIQLGDFGRVVRDMVIFNYQNRSEVIPF